MANYADFTCNRCGFKEIPMNHKNPKSRCRGEFYWINNRDIKCDSCGDVWPESNSGPWWCANCSTWHTNYRVD